MQLHEVMSSPVVTTTPQTSVARATTTLLHARVAALPVVDDTGALVGIVSELDLLRGRAAQDPRAHVRPVLGQPGPAPHEVGQVMTREVLALPPGADAADAVILLLASGVKSLPVVDGDRVVGVVGRRDLLRALVRDDDLLAGEVRLLMAEEQRPPEATVEVHDGWVTVSGTGEARRDDALRALVRTVPGVVGVTLRAVGTHGPAGPAEAGAVPTSDDLPQTIDREGKP